MGGGRGDGGNASAKGGSPRKDSASLAKGGESAANTSETAKPSLEEKNAKALTATEKWNIGAMKPSVYRKYICVGGGYSRFAFVYISFILCVVPILIVYVILKLP